VVIVVPTKRLIPLVYTFRVDPYNKDMALGDKYLKPKGCPKCGKDLVVIEGCFVWCVSFGLDLPWEGDFPEACGYRLIAG
jgi:hypothetical protein